MADQTEMKEVGAGQTPQHVLTEADGEDSSNVSDEVKAGFTASDQRDMQRMGKKQELRVSTAAFHMILKMLTWDRGTSGLLVQLALPPA